MPWYYATTLYNLNKTDILDKNVEIIKMKRNNDSDSVIVDRKKREADDEAPTEGDEYTQEIIFKTKYQKYICTFSEENLCNFKLEAKQNEIATTYTCNEPCKFNEWM